MKRVVAAVFFVLLPVQGFAKDQLRRFRWSSSSNEGVRTLLAPGGKIPKLEKHRHLLRGVGEFVARENQMQGAARIAGAWKQTIVSPEGKVTYQAGAWKDDNSAATMGAVALTDSLERAMKESPELTTAARVFPPVLELKDNQAYWRIEYLTPHQDQLRYLHLSGEGKILAKGALDWDGVDGRALVFRRGPKLGEAQEETLRDLTGDGTVTGRLLHVVSALGLNVWSPELTFFFPANDRRFDLGQAYFTIDQGYRWLKEKLGVELDHPIEVKLHVGEGGVSNAAFYHRDTIYLGVGDGETYQDLIRDPSVLIHESIHALIDSYVGLPSEGEGGAFNEGFADLFTALILDNPHLGEASYLKGPYRRTLENQWKAYKDFAPGVYQNGTIVASTFWDMKPFLGTELTAKLAFRTLVRLGKGGQFRDFSSALTSAGEGLLSTEQKMEVVRIANARGWSIQ